MASSPQSNEMTSDTIPANSNIPSPSSIALQIHMNGLPSSAQTDNTDANSYKKRSSSTLSTVEKKHVEHVDGDHPVMQKFRGLYVIFEQPLNELKDWPLYFETKEAAGHAIQKGFLNLWSTFIIVETLLAGIAIQPFVSIAPNLSGWQLEVYGGLWTLALLLDFLGLGITALFLGYLLGNPSHLAWVWVCKIVQLIGIPVALVLLDTIWTLITISFSSWLIYGPRVGITCTVVAVFAVAAGLAICESFAKASKEIEELP
ncbi:hypothetical protein CY35_17G103500 [Sphagnum magellanicum]|nr:hypothetical protein CY35_17G103500 [Sphagnum magellanicum]